MVKVTAERIPDSQVRLNIEVEPERVERSVEKAYRKLVGQINIPGFRRGKAPRQILERYVGRSALVQEGLETLLSDVYQQAVKELDLHPIDQPELELEPKATELKPGDALVVRATVPVRPIVEVGDYRNVRVIPMAVDVTAQEVNDLVDEVRERHAEWRTLERQVRQGDHVRIDLHGAVGTYTRLYSASGEPLLVGGTGRPFIDVRGLEVELGEEPWQLPPAAVEQIVGMVPGQEKQFEVTLPPDFRDSEIAGRLATFRVKLHELREKHLPPADDELAKAEGFESLEAMREALRARALFRAQLEAAEVYEQAVLQEVLARSTVEVPAVMANREVEHLIEEARESLKRRRSSLDEYLKHARSSEAELREMYRAQAARNIQVALLLARIAELEGIEVSEEEVEALASYEAAVARQQGAEARPAEADQREGLEDRIRRRKALQLLLSLARGEADREPSAAEPAAGESPAAGEGAVEAAAEAAAAPGEATEPEAPPSAAAEPGPELAAEPAPDSEPASQPEPASELEPEHEPEPASEPEPQPEPEKEQETT